MIETLCKQLTNTYDTNILDNQPDHIQDEFLNVSLQNRNNITNPGKKVLMELICNHYNKLLKKPTAEFIGGPKTLSIHWHPFFQKIIYIFGEWHNNNMDCEKDAVMVPVEDYLYNLMLSTDVFLDIFIELRSYKGGEYLYNPYNKGRRTSELFEKFRTCLQYNTRSDESCQLARVHYFDIRNNNLYEINMEDNKITILWFKQKIQSILLLERNNKSKCVSFLKLILQKFEKISTFLKELVQDDIKKVCEFMKKQLAEEPSIKKELGKIVENPQLKTKILTFCGKMICKEIKKNIKYIKQSGINILNYEKESEDVLFESMENIELLLSGSMTIFADAYLLARVFKNFDIKKKAHKGETDQPIHANNIIIYCGNTHANKYRNFLQRIGFEEIEHAGDLTEDPAYPIPNTPKNCLDMKKIKQPFFSYKRYNL